MCRRSRQMEANSSENGMVSATMSAPRILPRKINRMIDDQDHSFGEVVQHRVRGVVHQVVAVQVRNDLHARRQNLIVERSTFAWMPSSVVAVSAPLRRNTMPSTTSLSSTTTPSARWIALPICPSRIFGPCVTIGDIAHPQRRAVLRLQHGLFDVVDVGDQSHCSHIDLLRALLDEASAGVGVGVGELLLHLRRCSAHRRPACRDRRAPGIRA